MLFVVTFPQYRDPEDGRRVEAWRHRFAAPFAEAVPGHVTLVFGTDTLSCEALQTHAHAVADVTPSFPITFAAPLIWPENDAHLLFAVPDAGLSGVAALHDRLYTGPLAPALRTDLPYLPHMTLGQCTSYAAAAAAQDGLRADLPIAADIRTLAILDTTQGIETVATISLGAGI